MATLSDILVDEDKVKLREWYEERNRRRMREAYRTAGDKLQELVDANKELRTKLVAIHVEGASHTRRGFLESIIEPYLAEASKTGVTLPEVLNATHRLGKVLVRTDAFREIRSQLRRNESIYGGKDELELLVKVKPRSRFFARTSTEIGNNEGSASINTTIRSLFQSADSMSASLSFGTRNRRALDFSFTAPLVALDPEVETWAALHAFARETDWTSSSGCVLREEGMKAVLRMMKGKSRSEFAYEAGVRRVGDLLPEASIRIREEAGSSVRSALTHSWIYDSRDDPSGMSGTRGIYFKTLQELAGGFLGGDAYHLKTSFESQLSRGLLPGITISLAARTGLLYPLGSTPKTALADRFFMGGSSSVRMFKERGMGPHDKGDALGGEIAWSTGVSLIGDIPKKAHWPLKWHAFVNAGRLDAYNPSEDLTPQILEALRKPSLSAGLGLTYMFDPVRIEMNFGMPLVRSAGEKVRKGLQVGVGIEFL
ncbi:hypothetical protein SISSUDRAFT_1045638 [Sistotremastrum suecicum HHB10207 ss-3]|uniref:Bacterial surface antigen (D15) domain-containing protein n=1 Tax=Sistotremastrum suecicum HHB10207 ss-3 TaxID=1314776 RepID=A0A166ED18_9AGAM|nr:hypothetical protein SISSUDRAFT_1045638 [Sistotremastrum suecicum HHB10207 ss-3]